MIGNIEIIQMLINHGCQTTEEDIKAAFEQDHKEALDILVKNKNGYSPSSPDGVSLQQLLSTLGMEYQIQDIMNVESEILEKVDDVQAKISALKTQKPLTLSALFRELLPLATSWQTIGENLKIPSEILSTIGIDCQYRGRDCLREMLDEWLKMIEPLPTWEQLVQAVMPIDKEKAETLQVKHCLS